jgi:hypothetical protein
MRCSAMQAPMQALSWLVRRLFGLAPLTEAAAVLVAVSNRSRSVGWPTSGQHGPWDEMQ